LKSGLIRWVASLEGDNSLVFYYLRAFEIWPDKMGSREATHLIRPDFKCPR
jgi:hypothetical protein